MAYSIPKGQKSLALFSLCWHSSKAEAKKRYFALSLIYHPDKAETDEARKVATIRQQKINHAWEELCDMLPDDRGGLLPFPQCCEKDPRNSNSRPADFNTDPSIFDSYPDVSTAPKLNKRDRNHRKRRRAPHKPSTAEKTEKTQSSTKDDSTEFPEFTQRQSEEAEAFWANLKAGRQTDTTRVKLHDDLHEALRELLIGSACVGEMLRATAHTAKGMQRYAVEFLLQSSVEAFQQNIRATYTVISRTGFSLPRPSEVTDRERVWFASQPKLFDGLPRSLRKLWKTTSSLYTDYHYINNVDRWTADRAQEAEASLKEEDGVVGLPKRWRPHGGVESWEDEDDLLGIDQQEAHTKICRGIATRQLLRRLVEEGKELENQVKKVQDTDFCLHVDFKAYGIHR